MVDQNSPEAFYQRASKEEDPLTVYVVVRESLNMSVGKLAIQCAHAGQMLQLKYDDLHKGLNWRRRTHTEAMPADELEAFVMKSETIYQEWLAAGVRKVSLTASEKEWDRLKAEEKNKLIVIDAGLTELEPGTETVMILWPIRKSQRSKTVKRLQALK